MELQVGVKVLLRNPEGKYLVMLRSPIKYPESVKWDIPGGRIDPGSPLFDNLSREVKEETALALSSVPKLIAAQDILKNPGKHVVRLTYIGVASGEPTLSEEHTEYKWVSFDELRGNKDLDHFVTELIEQGIISEATGGY